MLLQHVFLEYFREKPAGIDAANWRDQLDVSNLGYCYLHAGFVSLDVSKFVYTNLPKTQRGSSRASSSFAAVTALVRAPDVKSQGRTATGCHTAAHPTVGGCPRCPTAVKDGRRAGRLLIEDVGSGEY